MRVAEGTKREAGKGSDCDITVDLREGEGLLKLVSLKQDLEDKLWREADLVIYGGLNPILKKPNLEGQVPIEERAGILGSVFLLYYEIVDFMRVFKYFLCF